MSRHPASPHDPTSTRERLRAVAAELFARLGYEGASMADIAAGVGIRKASLYNYYPSKEDLLMDLVRESLAAWALTSPLEETAGATFAECLRLHMLASVEFTQQHPEKVAILRIAATQIGGELGRRVFELIEEHRRAWLGRLRAFLARAVAAGEVVDADPEDLALVVSAFEDGVLSSLLCHSAGAERYGAGFGQLWDLFWRGLAAPTKG